LRTLYSQLLGIYVELRRLCKALQGVEWESVLMDTRRWERRTRAAGQHFEGSGQRAWWRLEDCLVHVPLTPPGVWRRKELWLGWLAVVAIVEALMPPPLVLFPVACAPVGLAAWCGSLAWSLSLALANPWLHLVAWWWGGQPWSLWIEGVNTAMRLALGVVAALGVTSWQRQACRLALERNPRLPPRQRAS
jgi:hypothetical protein